MLVYVLLISDITKLQTPAAEGAPEFVFFIPFWSLLESAKVYRYHP